MLYLIWEPCLNLGSGGETSLRRDRKTEMVEIAGGETLEASRRDMSTRQNQKSGVAFGSSPLQVEQAATGGCERVRSEQNLGDGQEPLNGSCASWPT